MNFKNNRSILTKVFAPLAVVGTLVLGGCVQWSEYLPFSATHSQRQEIDFNFGWKFTKNLSKDDTSRASTVDFDDSDWDQVRLPHDWSIESNYSQEKSAGATGYLPGGEGWYRKSFKTPVLTNTDGKAKTQILFDGIYNQSEVWINGVSLGQRPYGYAPFYHDLTEHLHQDGSDNVIAVYVDRTRYVDSRWYTGSGIYRNVSLITTEQVHIPIWGTFVTTPSVTKQQAEVSVVNTVQNDGETPINLDVKTEILDLNGNRQQSETATFVLAANSKQDISQRLTLSSPKLWSPDSPNMYLARVSVFNGDTLIDQKDTRFGVRTFKNDPNLGFFLNGKNLKIKGVNLHHDAGLVGAAVPKGVWQRRLTLLKDAGVNTIRTAHNPASKEFLNLCDEMGFLVQEEAFDEWDNPKDKRKNFNQQGEIDYITESYNKHFSEWAERDLKAMLMRDRNHPSIFQWSIGNEIEWTYPKYPGSTGYWDKENKGQISYYWDTPPLTPNESQARFANAKSSGPELADTAAKLANWTKEVDTTRPVTANMVTPSVSHYTGYGEVLDIIGYSYRQSVYEYGHKHYPNKMIVGTENWVQWHEWQAILDKPYIPGIMVWTGIDYLGESNGKWPKKGTNSGMLDFAGFTKPSYHMMKTVWSDTPHVSLTTRPMADSAYKVKDGKVIEKEKDSWKKGKWSWRDVNQHWNYEDGELISVEVYTNQAAVELFQNGQSLGIQYLTNNPDHILKWAVKFSNGKLEAKTVNSNSATSDQLITASEAVAIELTTDKPLLNNDQYDVAHIVAQLVDKDGNPVQHTEQTINFTIPDTLRWLGVDNGSSSNIQPHKSTSITTYKGRALLIVQSKDQQVAATIEAKSDKLTTGKAFIIVE
jgi:beta-galactosidase